MSPDDTSLSVQTVEEADLRFQGSQDADEGADGDARSEGQHPEPKVFAALKGPFAAEEEDEDGDPDINDLWPDIVALLDVQTVYRLDYPSKGPNGTVVHRPSKSLYITHCPSSPTLLTTVNLSATPTLCRAENCAANHRPRDTRDPFNSRAIGRFVIQQLIPWG